MNLLEDAWRVLQFLVDVWDAEAHGV